MTDSDDRQTVETLAVIERFNDAFNRHDVDAIMAMMTDDCVFDSTRPPPDGDPGASVRPSHVER